MRHRPLRVLLASAIAAASIVIASGGLAETALGAPVSGIHHRTTSSLTLNLPSYRPSKPVAGGHDDYHCSLIFPGNTTDQMITSTTFTPGSVQVHHVILYLGYANQLAAAKKLNANGKGWTCFGAPQLDGSTTVSEISKNPWLAASGPGKSTGYEPTGTGMPLPAGAFIIVQVHYNLLVGCGPTGVSPTDHSSVTLGLTPAAGSGLKPLAIHQIVAPPDLPCPAGVHGSLCSRSASLVDLGKRFGQGEVNFVNLIEFTCGRADSLPSNTSGVTSTSCTWPVDGAGVIQDIAPHMHLLGSSMTVSLIHNGVTTVLLNDASWNFDNQRAYDLTPAVPVVAGDKLIVSCSYNPSLRALLPQTSALPPRYITWGDGSSDEMCLASYGETQN